MPKRGSIRQVIMHPSYRALFLIAATLTVLHVSPVNTLIVLLG
jgi:hypothetical protein